MSADSVVSHYTHEEPIERILASIELLKSVKLRAPSRLLDIGCGIGGAARTLAAATGCTVNGIDLVPTALAASQAHPRPESSPQPRSSQPNRQRDRSQIPSQPASLQSSCPAVQIARCSVLPRATVRPHFDWRRDIFGNMKQHMGLVVVTVVALAACGGGSSDEASSAGGSTDQFCEILRATNLADDAEGPAVAELRALAEQAPDSIRVDVVTVVDAIEALSGVDESDPEAFETAFAIILSPEFVEAGERLRAFGVEECGLEPADEGFSDSEADASINASGELDDPLYNPLFDDPIDPSVASYEGAQSFIDQNYPTAPWRTRLGSWSLSSGDAAELGAGGVDITAAEAVEVCTAIADYLRPIDPAGTIIISTYEHLDDGTFGAESEVLASSVDGGC
jgi:SAM-dependent methyltransferase